MIKREGDDMGWAKDMGVIGQRREKNTKGKPLKNNAKHENEQKQTEALQKNYVIKCLLGRNDQFWGRMMIKVQRNLKAIK